MIHAGLVAATCALLAGSCSIFQAPIERRIEKGREVFDSFPPKVRENVRLGQIEIGYDEDMVRIALGQPDRRYRRRDPEGETMIWIYLERKVRSRSQWAMVDLPTFDPQGRRIILHEALKLNLEERHEHTRARVEFAAGKVYAFEQLSD